MSHKTPFFWYGKSKAAHVISFFLQPLGYIYYACSLLYQKIRKPYKASVPVLCVGNLSVGGSGKTPTVIYWVHFLKSKGHTPHIISRGYGTSHITPLCVDPAVHTPGDVGDEPLLLSIHAPTWVCQDRVRAAKKAQENGATIIIMDDGLQNESLHKDFKVVVVDALQQFGNEKLFPAGPLRVPVFSGLQNSDAIFYLNGKATDTLPSFLNQKPFFEGAFVPTLPVPPCCVVAFAGIGYPLKFKVFLENHGYIIEKFIEFPDHHAYVAKDLEILLDQSKGLPLLTTEKDYIKLPIEFSHAVYSVPITLVMRHEKELFSLLQEKKIVETP